MKLGRAQILEAVHAQVADVRVHEHTGRLRQEHLPTVADGSDTCALVDVEADVSLLGQPWLARVQPHPHTYRPVGKCKLAVRSGGDGVRRAVKATKNASPCVSTSTPSWSTNTPRGVAPPMLVQTLPVVVAKLVQQPRRALHVREQQSHHSTWELAGHVAMISPGSGHVQCGSCAAARGSSTGAPARS